MPIPVPIPSGPLPITDADTARAEQLVATLAQIFEFGTSGGTPAIQTPATVVPNVNPNAAPTTLVIDSASKQLYFRSLALAVAKSIFTFASASQFGVTKLSTDPSIAGDPVALNSEEVTTTPTANQVPRARPDGTLDPAWITGGGSTPVFGTFNGTCQTTDLVGDAVRLTGSSAHDVTRVNPIASGTMPAIGVIVSKPTTTTCVVQGVGVATGIYTGLTIGKMYWIGNNGRPLSTPPTGSAGAHLYAQPLGLAVSATDLFLTGDQEVYGFYR